MERAGVASWRKALERSSSSKDCSLKPIVSWTPGPCTGTNPLTICSWVSSRLSAGACWSWPLRSACSCCSCCARSTRASSSRLLAWLRPVMSSPRVTLSCWSRYRWALAWDRTWMVKRRPRTSTTTRMAASWVLVSLLSLPSNGVPHHEGPVVGWQVQAAQYVPVERHLVELAAVLQLDQGVGVGERLVHPGAVADGLEAIRRGHVDPAHQEVASCDVEAAERDHPLLVDAHGLDARGPEQVDHVLDVDVTDLPPVPRTGRGVRPAALAQG